MLLNDKKPTNHHTIVTKIITNLWAANNKGLSHGCYETIHMDTQLTAQHTHTIMLCKLYKIKYVYALILKSNSSLFPFKEKCYKKNRHMKMLAQHHIIHVNINYKKQDTPHTYRANL